ncbi:hypothetical protein ACIGD1_15960 [Streptomyces sp. NPDC085612]|uniref:hypothetical protein n=1 Tax=Streptomyces sp. NPDC085612 TaxID=3365732 RepID=UPI0037D17668
MTRDASPGTVERGWDEPWYRVRTDAFEASFLPGAGEALGGRFFWVSDGLIVRDPGVDSMTGVIAGLIGTDEFTTVFQRVEDD